MDGGGNNRRRFYSDNDVDDWESDSDSSDSDSDSYASDINSDDRSSSVDDGDGSSSSDSDGTEEEETPNGPLHLSSHSSSSNIDKKHQGKISTKKPALIRAKSAPDNNLNSTLGDGEPQGDEIKVKKRGRRPSKMSPAPKRSYSGGSAPPEISVGDDGLSSTPRYQPRQRSTSRRKRSKSVGDSGSRTTHTDSGSKAEEEEIVQQRQDISKVPERQQRRSLSQPKRSRSVGDNGSRGRPDSPDNYGEEEKELPPPPSIRDQIQEWPMLLDQEEKDDERGRLRQGRQRLQNMFVKPLILRPAKSVDRLLSKVGVPLTAADKKKKKLKKKKNNSLEQGDGKQPMLARSQSVPTMSESSSPASKTKKKLKKKKKPINITGDSAGGFEKVERDTGNGDVVCVNNETPGSKVRSSSLPPSKSPTLTKKKKKKKLKQKSAVQGVAVVDSNADSRAETVRVRSKAVDAATAATPATSTTTARNPQNRQVLLKRSKSANQIAAESEHGSSVGSNNIKKGKKKKKKRTLSLTSQPDADNTRPLLMGDNATRKEGPSATNFTGPRRRRPSALQQKYRSKSETTESTADSDDEEDPVDRPGLHKRSKSMEFNNKVAETDNGRVAGMRRSMSVDKIGETGKQAGGVPITKKAKKKQLKKSLSVPIKKKSLSDMEREEGYLEKPSSTMLLAKLTNLIDDEEVIPESKGPSLAKSKSVNKVKNRRKKADRLSSQSEHIPAAKKGRQQKVKERLSKSDHKPSVVEEEESLDEEEQAELSKHLKEMGIMPEITVVDDFEDDNTAAMSTMSLGGESYLLDLAAQKQNRDMELKQEALEESFVLYHKAIQAGFHDSKDTFFQILEHTEDKLQEKYQDHFDKQDQRLEEAVIEMAKKKKYKY